MKHLLTVLLLASTLSLAQTVDSPTVAGNLSVLSWTPSPATDGVNLYSIYRIQGSTITKVASVPAPPVTLPALLPGNGTYALFVTATNPAGESDPSTNIYIKYFANKPHPPGTLIIK